MEITDKVFDPNTPESLDVAFNDALAPRATARRHTRPFATLKQPVENGALTLLRTHPSPTGTREREPASSLSRLRERARVRVDRARKARR